jgi:hypothetical protein
MDSKIVIITIMASIEDDIKAVELKAKIDNLVRDIPESRVDFRLTTRPDRPT